MKAVGDPVKLSVTLHRGPAAVPGDALRTNTGRTYLILAVKGKRHDCLVVDPDDVIPGVIYRLIWNSRNKR
jgi:hypothetical protein